VRTGGGLFREKALFDYTYLMEPCYDSGAPYMTLFEDDIIALDGWFHRTMNALSVAGKQTARLGAKDCTLFYYSEDCTHHTQFYAFIFFTRKNFGGGTKNTGRYTSRGQWLSPVRF
jgi:hypothetical protein